MRNKQTGSTINIATQGRVYQTTNMKLATILTTTAAANVSSYIAENWWKEGLKVFNYVSDNQAKILSAINSVS